MKPVMPLVLAVAIAVLAGQAQAGVGGESVKSAFERMRGLAGTWQGKDEEGQPATVKYEVMSGGSIVTETLQPGQKADEAMLTVYHLDGDKLLCTHYCSRNNQPRMRLESYNNKDGTLDFDFVDATNLPNEHEGHMHKLVLKNPDKDHLVQEWSWHENGQQTPAIFHFERKK
jgi:hypothetical protein